MFVNHNFYKTCWQWSNVANCSVYWIKFSILVLTLLYLRIIFLLDTLKVTNNEMTLDKRIWLMEPLSRKCPFTSNKNRFLKAHAQVPDRYKSSPTLSTTQQNSCRDSQLNPISTDSAIYRKFFHLSQLLHNKPKVRE
jgi:hypothetical protein